MTIDYARLKSWPFADVEHRYTARDTMLYALGLGCGSDPTDPDELRFVYEDGLLALPGRAPIGAVPNWITLTPDSRALYVSNSTLNAVSAIDVASMKIIANIPVGQVPKRNGTLTLRDTTASR